MHANSHLGVSLATMAQLAAATPNLGHAFDTHQPSQVDEGGKGRFGGGALAVPEGPGLGVTLDREAPKRLHGTHLACCHTKRDDAGEMKTHWPDRSPGRPRF